MVSERDPKAQTLNSVATVTLVIAAFLLLISVVQPAAERLHLPYTVLLAVVGVPLTVALLLGAIVATTDPAAVVTIFRELGAPPRLSRLLEGESLLNDAAAIVLFGILVDMLTNGIQSNFTSGAVRFAEAFVGGVILGMVGGRVFGAILPFLRGSRMAEVTLSVALPHIVYVLGEE